MKHVNIRFRIRIKFVTFSGLAHVITVDIFDIFEINIVSDDLRCCLNCVL